MYPPSPSRIPILTNQGVRYLDPVDSTIISFLKEARYPAGRLQPVPQIVITPATSTTSKSSEEEMDIVEPQPNPENNSPDPSEWEDVRDWEEEWDMIDDRPKSPTPESKENGMVIIRAPEWDPDPIFPEPNKKTKGPESDPDLTSPFPPARDMPLESVDDQNFVMVQEQPRYIGPRTPLSIPPRAPEHEHVFKRVILWLQYPLGERKEPKVDRPSSQASTWSIDELRQHPPAPPQGFLPSRPIPTLSREDAVCGNWLEVPKTHREERPWLPHQQSDSSTEGEYICQLGVHHSGRHGMNDCKVYADGRSYYVQSEPQLVSLRKERAGSKKRLQGAMRKLRRMRMRFANQIRAREATNETIR
ncbi:hypothetical protein BGZ60DRAFT_413533 [Tricladium varicosporioides]|nr:hypothetical protein BGZ60DRAFT_413533 [Hymenoscyphus varicosporioides]